MNPSIVYIQICMKKYLVNIYSSQKDMLSENLSDTFLDLHKRLWVITYNINIGKNDGRPTSDSTYCIYKDIKKNDILNFIKKHCKKDHTYINTFDEKLVTTVNKLKKSYGQPYTALYSAFTNKRIERNIAKNTDIIPQFCLYKDINLHEYNWKFPVVIKPTKGAQSSGVSLIKNKTDLKNYVKNLNIIEWNLSKRKYKNNFFLIEEYVNWPMYTITYFVDVHGNIFYDTFCSVETLEKVWIHDFALLKRKIVRSHQDNKKIEQKIESIIYKTVKTYDIKNTFIHQEVRLSKEWKLRNIEINWRVWWYRIELYKLWVNRNIFDYAFLTKKNKKNISSNVVAYSIFPQKDNCILQWFNEDIIEKIKQLPSVQKVRILKSHIGKNTWYAKSWYTRLWSIILEHKDESVINQDSDFIEKNYKYITIQ